MDKDLAMQYMTDKLAGELPPEKDEALAAALHSNPEWAEEARRMQEVWALSQNTENAENRPMSKKLRDTLADAEGISPDTFTDKYHLDS